MAGLGGDTGTRDGLKERLTHPVPVVHLAAEPHLDAVADLHEGVDRLHGAVLVSDDAPDILGCQTNLVAPVRVEGVPNLIRQLRTVEGVG